MDSKQGNKMTNEQKIEFAEYAMSMGLRFATFAAFVAAREAYFAKK